MADFKNFSGWGKAGGSWKMACIFSRHFWSLRTVTVDVFIKLLKLNWWKNAKIITYTLFRYTWSLLQCMKKSVSGTRPPGSRPPRKSTTGLGQIYPEATGIHLKPRSGSGAIYGAGAKETIKKKKEILFFYRNRFNLSNGMIYVSKNFRRDRKKSRRSVSHDGGDFVQRSKRRGGGCFLFFESPNIWIFLLSLNIRH